MSGCGQVGGPSGNIPPVSISTGMKPRKLDGGEQVSTGQGPPYTNPFMTVGYTGGYDKNRSFTDATTLNLNA